jgi:hypothetical protein
MFKWRGIDISSPNPNLKDNHISVVSDCLFNTFAATLDIGHFSISNMRTRHAVVAGTDL